MTTIMLDVDRAKLYTDGRCTRENEVVWWRELFNKLGFSVANTESTTEVVTDEFVKVFKTERLNGQYVLYAGTGRVKEIRKAVHRWAGGEPPKRLRESTILRIISGQTPYQRLHKKLTIETTSRTCGSGSDKMLCLYNAGFSEEEAYLEAVRQDEYSGGRILEWDLSGRRWDEDIH